MNQLERGAENAAIQVMSLLYFARSNRVAVFVDRLKRVLRSAGARRARINPIDPSTLPAQRLRDLGLLDGKGGTSDENRRGCGTAAYRDLL
ncbi:hypothetical protein [Mangrovibrevibacter kandeliae]|uniref:hypothetical protein n=1 Tax=Mangrovibrevibacter kandeliae TaxID=2968473 RepID=UPI002117D09C|nr:hypothetical protein [Aurantimonas sp. CSK15Z-1]MCQ8783505.1 hypothetical protein [Aurantimonas sp. CSK15Z-1]